MIKILCHVLSENGHLHRVYCSFNTVAISASDILHHAEIKPLISDAHIVFAEPSTPMTQDEQIAGLSEVFVLGPARISPAQWRQKRLMLSRAAAKKSR